MIVKIGRILLLLIALAASMVRPVRAQTGQEAGIFSPVDGAVLQGTVAITGSNNLEGFVRYRIDFTYYEDTTGTWFSLAAGDQQVDGGTLANWDTSTITDGNYTIRMLVFLADGSTREFQVKNLRVRNYSSIETPTPAPTPLRPTDTPTLTLTSTVFPSATIMPTNQAVITTNDLSVSIGYGGLAAIAIFLVLGFYLWVRRK